MYVCLCKGLTESDVRQAAATSPADQDALIAILGLEDEDCCGRCLERADELAALAASPCTGCPLRHAPADRLDSQSGLLR